MEIRQLEGYPKCKDFIAIDFETATNFNPCQIGMAIVKNGIIVQTINRLIRPPHNLYNPQTIHIHHITPDLTENAPEFPEVWNDIKHYFDDAILVAHNARYDINVLCSALNFYRLDFPNIVGYICTCDLNHRESLELACARYGICLENHHDGEDDAINCAQLYLAYVNDMKKSDIEDIPSEFRKNNSHSFSWSKAFEGHDVLKGDVLKKDLTGADPSNPFYDRKVVITGLFNIDRLELASTLKSMGADIDSNVSCKTNYLIIGKDPGPSKIRKCEDLIASGKNIRKIFQADLDLILSGEKYEEYYTDAPVSRARETKVKERKTTWPNLVKKYKRYIEGEDVQFSEQELQSEDYRVLNLYFQQQQKVATTKETILINIRELEDDKECEFRKDILSCFSEGESVTKEEAYERMQNVFTKYGLFFKAKTCLLVEFGVIFEEYKVKGIHYLTIKHIPQY